MNQIVLLTKNNSLSASHICLDFFTSLQSHLWSKLINYKLELSANDLVDFPTLYGKRQKSAALWGPDTIKRW